jgi:hypothetical protein
MILLLRLIRVRPVRIVRLEDGNAIIVKGLLDILRRILPQIVVIWSGRRLVGLSVIGIVMVLRVYRIFVTGESGLMELFIVLVVAERVVYALDRVLIRYPRNQCGSKVQHFSSQTHRRLHGQTVTGGHLKMRVRIVGGVLMLVRV